ncbi:MAG: polysaccharide biosynthesis protein [Planctomycetota bacterium]|nr:MAG: polysaccharide biosynthesis protein [Planctomycetota bacterium]
MPPRAIMIGTAECCRRLERQLDLMVDRPVSLGWVVSAGREPAGPAVLGTLRELDAIVARTRPDLALVTFPAVMDRLVTATRTRLRRLGVADRFMPTLEDQVAGIGPRSHLEIDPGALLNRAPRHIDRQAVRRVIAGRRVLITGAGGSIGGELARIVSRYDAAELILVERSENALFEIDRQIARSAPELARTALLHDIVDAEATMEHFRRLRPHVIFHAAAHKHVPMMEDHPAAAVDNNYFGTMAVADAAHANAAERFVLISTDKAVNPSSIMGATKRLAELYVQHLNQRSDTGFSVVRFGNVIGSTGSVLDVWTRELAEGGPLTVTDPRMTRYFMTIPEAASLVIQSAALVDPRTRASGVFLLDMGVPIRIVDLARRLIALHGYGPDTIEIVFTGARPGEKLHEQLAYDTEAIRPTAHPDIHVWEQPAPDPGSIQRTMNELSPGRRGTQAKLVAETVRRLVTPPQVTAAA